MPVNRRVAVSISLLSGQSEDICWSSFKVMHVGLGTFKIFHILFSAKKKCHENLHVIECTRIKMVFSKQEKKNQ